MCAVLANAESSVPFTVQRDSQERPEAYVFVGTGDGEAASCVIKCTWDRHGTLRAQLLIVPLVGESFSRLFEKSLMNCAISSTGQLLCHSVHGSCQGEGGPCPESGGDSQWERRRDSGKFTALGQLFSEDWGLGVGT